MVKVTWIVSPRVLPWKAIGLTLLKMRARSSGKENQQCETFHWNPAGNQSRPAEPGQQPEASHARWRVTSTAKRSQRDQTLCD